MAKQNYRITVRLNETLQGRKLDIGHIEVEVSAKDIKEARRKAKEKAAKKRFKMSNLAVYDIFMLN